MAQTEHLKRQYYCGKIDESFIAQQVTIYGWVNRKREFGGLTFIDLRDREGVLQIVVNDKFPDQKLVKEIGNEYVLAVTGTIVARSNPNPDIFSGKVELIAGTIAILSPSAIPPFLPESKAEVSDELRFKYRYIDLRTLRLQKNFKIRSQANLAVRNYLDRYGFLDIETPILAKTTPEGARDYLVPSRIYKGKMFALPQSPQLFKQLLMISGFERYFQIVKCFRDEDLRADRQPEFTQIDIELSFGETPELFDLIEGLIAEIFALKGITIQKGFRIMPFREAMDKYGSDKPDLRIPFEIQDFTQKVQPLASQVLDAVIGSGGLVKGLVLPNAAGYSRKILDEIDAYVKNIGGKGAIWMKNTENGFKSSLKIEPAASAHFFQENNIQADHIVFLVGGTTEKAPFFAGKLREHLGREYTQGNKDRLEFLWVVDFPLFFYNEEEKRYESNHHPFTSPHLEDLDKLDTDPLAVRSIAYDLVLNGIEIGGGSSRINTIDLQKKVFTLLNFSDREAEDKFGFFLDAFKYGAPPHLGIALGLDRIIMLLAGEDSIREVIAFPKTTSSLCLLTGSPSAVPDKQLAELGIRLVPS